MQVEDFDYFLLDITKVLKVFGIDFWGADWKFRKSNRLILPVFLVFLYAFVFEFYYLIYYQDNPAIIVKSLFVSIGTETLLVKLTMTFWYRKEIIALLLEIKNDFWSFHDDNCLKREILVAGSTKMKFFVRLYIGYFIVGVIFSVNRPLIALIFSAKFEAPMPVTMPGDKISIIYQLNNANLKFLKVFQMRLGLHLSSTTFTKRSLLSHTEF